jgi:hypothetical protein
MYEDEMGVFCLFGVINMDSFYWDKKVWNYLYSLLC